MFTIASNNNVIEPELNIVNMCPQVAHELHRISLLQYHLHDLIFSWLFNNALSI
jgi:hypothetical protein